MPRKKRTEEGTAELVPTGFLPVAVQTELTADRGNLQEALQLAQIMPLDTQEGVTLAGEMIAMAMELKAQKETQRTSVTGPLNQAVKTINSWFKPVTETCDSIVSVLKSRVIQALEAGEKAQDAALQAIEDAGGKASPEHLLIAHNTPVKPDNMTLTKVMVGKVTQFGDVPDRFKMINATALAEAIEAGERNIPGIEIVEETRAIARRK